MKPIFLVQGLTPKILFSEGKNWDDIAQFPDVLNDSTLKSWIYATATHPYDINGEINAPPQSIANIKKPHWQSEYDDISYSGPTMEKCAPYFQKMVQALVNGNVSAWLMGNFASPDKWVGDGLPDSIYWHDDAVDKIVKQKAAYGFGQFSKFIRPGMVRIASGIYGTNNIYVAAFK